MDFDTSFLKEQQLAYRELILELENQLAIRSGYKGHLQRQSNEFWEEKYWEVVRKFNVLNDPLSILLRKGLEYPTKDTREPLDIALVLQQYYYRTLPNRNISTDTRHKDTFILSVFRAVELLREYARIKMEQQVSEDTKDTKDTKDNVVSLKLLKGGKGDDSGDNWLIDLPIGSIFLCKKKDTKETEFLAFQFVMDWKGKRGVLLSSNMPSRVELAVDSVGFCKTHDLIEVQRKGLDHGTTD